MKDHIKYVKPWTSHVGFTRLGSLANRDRPNRETPHFVSRFPAGNQNWAPVQTVADTEASWSTMSGGSIGGGVGRGGGMAAESPDGACHGDRSGGGDGDLRHNPKPSTYKGKSCKGCLYYSSRLRSDSSNPMCVGISRTLPQGPFAFFLL